MKNKIFIFVPINIGRNLEGLLKRKAPDSEFITPKSSAEELKYFASVFENPVPENLPELVVTLQPEILKYFQNENLRIHYDVFDESYPRLRTDLQSAGFDISYSFIKPLLFTPVILLVNKDVKKKPTRWKDLLLPQFHGKILLPDAQTPVSIAFKEILKDMGEQGIDEFFDALKFSGLPFEIISAVNKGLYDVGVLPLPFTRYNMGSNIEPVFPEDGMIILPEMMFLRKNASTETKEVAKYLYSENIQRFFSQLGALIPVIENIPFPAEIKDNMKFYWHGWNWYKNLFSKSKL